MTSRARGADFPLVDETPKKGEYSPGYVPMCYEVSTNAVGELAKGERNVLSKKKRSGSSKPGLTAPKRKREAASFFFSSACSAQAISCFTRFCPPSVTQNATVKLESPPKAF